MIFQFIDSVKNIFHNALPYLHRMNPKIIEASEAALLIKDNDTLCIGGGGAGHAVPDKLLEALGERFIRTSSPKKKLISFTPVVSVKIMSGD